MFSKVYDFSLDVQAILELKAEIENTTPTHEFYMHNDTAVSYTHLTLPTTPYV